MVDPTANNPENKPSDPTQGAAGVGAAGGDPGVLTLHHGLMTRWATDAMLAHADTSSSFGQGSSALLGSLAGRAALPASFSSDAFQIATLLASSPRLSRAGGPEIRSLAVGEVADLVQIVLEQEEAALEAALAASAARGRPGRKPTAKRAPAKATTAAPRTEAAPAATSTPARAAAPMQTRKLAALRRALQAMRVEAAEVARTTAAGALTTGGDAALTGIDSDVSVGANVGVTGAAKSKVGLDLGSMSPNAASALARTERVGGDGLRATLAVLRGSAAVRGMPATFSAGNPVSLMDASVAQAGSFQFGSRALRLAEQSAERALLVPGLEAALSPAAGEATARVAARLRRPTEAGPATLAPRAPSAVERAASAAAPQSQARRTAEVALNALARPLGAGPDRGTLTPSTSPSAQASSRPEARSWASGTLGGPLPALTGAVRGAAGLLQRAAAGLTAWAGSSAGDEALPSALRALQPLAEGPALTALRPMASDTGATRAWMGASEALLRGAPATTVQGYRGLEAGAGAWLDLGAETAEPPAIRAVQGRAAATPAWIAPLTQSRTAPSASPLAGRPTTGSAADLRRPSAPGASALAIATAAAAARSGALAPQIAGGAGLSAYGWAARLGERVALGLEPLAPAPDLPHAALARQTLPAVSSAISANNVTSASSPALATGSALLRRAGLIDASGASDPTTVGSPGGAPWQAFGAAGATPLRGPLLEAAGPGDWLDLGAEALAEPTVAAIQTLARVRGASKAQVAVAAPKLPSVAAALSSLGAASGRLIRGPLAARPASGAGSATALRPAGGVAADLAASSPTASALTASALTASALTASALTASALTASALTAAAGAGPAQLGHAGARTAAPAWLAAASMAGMRPLDFALALPGADQAAVLEALGGGRVDALSPWLGARSLQRAFASAPRALQLADSGPGAMLDLGADSVEAATALPTSAKAGRRGRAGKSTAAAAPQAIAAPRALPQPARQASDAHRQLLRALQRGGAGPNAGALAAALLTPSAPPALKAALSLFGEGDVMGGDDVAGRFLARWLGAAETTRIAPSASTIAAAERIALQTGADGRSAPAIGREGGLGRGATLGGEGTAIGAVGERAAASGEQRMVFEGFGALAALRAMRGAGESETTLLDLGRVEPASAEATGRAGAKTSTAGAKGGEGVGPVAAAGPRAGTAARSHRFAPVGLARTHHALRRGGRDGLLRSVSRSSRLGASSVGYGSAALGGGALLGLGAQDPIDSLYGGGYASTGAIRRAERLGDAIHARRGGASGSGRAARLMPAGQAPSELLRTQGPTSLEQAFGAPPAQTSDLRFVSTATVAQSVAGARGPDASATASAKISKASSMARVLSVTAAPGADMLPLVAPAARAVVAQAAAKPMSESIATSGANGTLALPVAGHDVSGGGGAGSGMGATSEERKEAGTPGQQELEALAMKIARSVLVRIKRERERRGIHV